ncbi:MAG: hypothetical protein AAF357_12670, partial [Verrucomicrobiota bacterium]
MKKNTIYIVIAVVAVLVIVNFLTGRKDDSSSKINIAASVPLSGPIASFSGQYGNGLLMGVDEGCETLGIDRKIFDLDIQ